MSAADGVTLGTVCYEGCATAIHLDVTADVCGSAYRKRAITCEYRCQWVHRCCAAGAVLGALMLSTTSVCRALSVGLLAEGARCLYRRAGWC